MVDDSREARWNDYSGDKLTVVLFDNGNVCIATGAGRRTWVELFGEQAAQLEAFLATRALDDDELRQESKLDDTVQIRHVHAAEKALEGRSWPSRPVDCYAAGMAAGEAKRVRGLSRRVAQLQTLCQVLAEGIGNFQAGHEAPWDTACEDDRWVVECANSTHIMECDDDDFTDTTAEKHTRAICDSVNLAAEVSAALAGPFGGAVIDNEHVEKAHALLDQARRGTK